VNTELEERPEVLAHAPVWHQIVCYHEAGHVVACSVLDLPIRMVKLDYGLFTLAGGHVETKDAVLDAKPRADVVMSFAGHMAEIAWHERFGGTPDDSGSQSDFEFARTAMARCGMTEPEGRRLASILVAQNWGRITAVAAHLLRTKRMTQAQTARTIKSA
jgi:hypothetical protein